MPSLDDAARLDFACALARQLGARSLEAFRTRAMRVERKAGLDLVTDVDRDNERRIRAAVAESFPSDAVLGEEFGGVLEREVWVVDPIDGTHNFARGTPWWCISIAFLRDARPVIGLVYDPVHDELFSAREGLGAQLDAERLETAAVHKLPGTTIGFGLGAGRDASETLAVLTALSDRGVGLRGQGAGALSLCHVAAGRADGFFEREIHLWDVAAAMVILREAGADIEFPIDVRSPTSPAPVSAFAPGLRCALLAEAEQAPALGIFRPEAV